MDPSIVAAIIGFFGLLIAAWLGNRYSGLPTKEKIKPEREKEFNEILVNIVSPMRSHVEDAIVYGQRTLKIMDSGKPENISSKENENFGSTLISFRNMIYKIQELLKKQSHHFNNESTDKFFQQATELLDLLSEIDYVNFYDRAYYNGGDYPKPVSSNDVSAIRTSMEDMIPTLQRELAWIKNTYYKRKS